MNNQTSREDILVVETKKGLKTYTVVATYTKAMTVQAATSSDALTTADELGITESTDGAMNLLNWNAYLAAE